MSAESPRIRSGAQTAPSLSTAVPSWPYCELGWNEIPTLFPKFQGNPFPRSRVSIIIGGLESPTAPVPRRDSSATRKKEDHE